ncbi:hypothetical protein WN943_006398 [Citrus x changshan-huyou]
MGSIPSPAVERYIWSYTLAIMSGSPPLLLNQILFFLCGCAYSLPQYVLGRPFVITRPLILMGAIMSIFAFVNGLLKLTYVEYILIHFLR